jgi:hypothetical protein
LIKELRETILGMKDQMRELKESMRVIVMEKAELQGQCGPLDN